MEGIPRRKIVFTDKTGGIEDDRNFYGNSPLDFRLSGSVYPDSIDQIFAADKKSGRSMGLCTYGENTGKDFDFTCDSAEKSIYTTDAGLTDEEQNRVRALCLSVLDKEIYFENEPINACYFAISAGCTQPFENVWPEKSYPYLTAVACPSDLLAQGFQSAATFTEDEIRADFSEISFDDAPGKWFSDIQYFDTGYVEKLTVCGVEMTGVHVREALGLRSASFTVTYENDAFTFATLGYGHGVGMSQAAAITLAEGGMTVDEILARFYPGTDIK